MKKVTVTFLYSEEEGENDQYYKNLAFREIYDSADGVDYLEVFDVEDIGE